MRDNEWRYRERTVLKSIRLLVIVCTLGLVTAVVPRLSRVNRPAADVDSGVPGST